MKIKELDNETIEEIFELLKKVLHVLDIVVKKQEELQKLLSDQDEATSALLETLEEKIDIVKSKLYKKEYRQ